MPNICSVRKYTYCISVYVCVEDLCVGMGDGS